MKPNPDTLDHNAGEIVAVTTAGTVWKVLLMAVLTGYFLNLAMRLARGRTSSA